jgi:hypothetical protein
VVDTSHGSPDVNGDDDMHGDDVHVGQGRGPVVEVCEEAVLVDDLRLTVHLHVVLQTDVPGKALFAKVVKLKSKYR